MSRAEDVAAAYDKLARDYDAAYTGPVERAEDRQVAAALRRAYRAAPAGPVVDLGCGTGAALRLADPGERPWYGYDVSGRMVAQARRLHPGRAFRQLGAAAAAGEHPYGSVCVLTALYALNYTRPLEVAHRWAPVLVPGARIVVTALAPPRMQSPSWAIVNGSRRFLRMWRLLDAHAFLTALRAEPVRVIGMTWRHDELRLGGGHAAALAHGTLAALERWTVGRWRPDACRYMVIEGRVA